MILVSACLCGVKCKYNGEDNYCADIEKLVKEKKAIIVCPEQLGGMATPRKCSEICGGSGEYVLSKRCKVIDNEMVDVSQNFIKGAEETLKIARLYDVKYAILKRKSPSCGYGEIYDGSFKGNKVSGNGVTAELLHRNGIKIFNEENFKEHLNNMVK